MLLELGVARRAGCLVRDRCSSHPVLQFGGWSSTEEPRHELALIGTSPQSGEQPRKCFVHQAVGPVRGPNREPEVDEVHFDLPPSHEREQRDWVLVASAGPHGSGPHLIRERLKQVVECERPARCIVAQSGGISVGSCFDLRRSPGAAALVLVDDFRSHSGVDPSTHRFRVSREVRENMADGPAWQLRGTPDLGIAQVGHHGSEQVVRDPTPLDVGLGPHRVSEGTWSGVSAFIPRSRVRPAGCHEPSLHALTTFASAGLSPVAVS